MTDASFLDWPFFADEHRALASAVAGWAAAHLQDDAHGSDVDGAVRELARGLGDAGLLDHALPRPDGKFDVRGLCIVRETLARTSGLADCTFAMQGLGSAPIALFGSEALRQRYLPGVRDGSRVAAFALSEPQSGSDVAALATVARRDGDHYVLDGRKTWISNAGVAAQYVVFARTGEAPGARGLSAFVVDAGTPGLSVPERIDVIAPHVLGTLAFDGCRVQASNLLGAPGGGFRVAMATLDIFRTTVGAAALGFARRALAEAIARVGEREVFGQPLAAHQATQMRIAEMALEVDAAALLVYRAAWTRDCVADRVTREAAMAKLYATEAAQRVIDSAVQLFGGMGVVSGSAVERLYREIRPLRIYEGTSEIQKLVIAGQVLGRP